MHAIGDEACRMALDAVAGIDPLARPRIEHAQQVDSVDFRRFSGTIASMQPLHRADDGRFAESRLGPTRARGSFAFRRLLNAGAVGVDVFGAAIDKPQPRPIRDECIGLFVVDDGVQLVPDLHALLRVEFAATLDAPASHRLRRMLVCPYQNDLSPEEASKLCGEDVCPLGHF
jgi:hypothetical protein